MTGAVPGLVTEAMLGNASTDGTIHVRVKQWNSKVAVEQHPLAFIDVRLNTAGTVLHHAGLLENVHLVMQRRLLQVGEVSHAGVSRIVLGACWDWVRRDVDAYRLAAVDVGHGRWCRVAGWCGRTWSTAVSGGDSRVTLGSGAEECHVATAVS